MCVCVCVFLCVCVYVCVCDCEDKKENNPNVFCVHPGFRQEDESCLYAWLPYTGKVVNMDEISFDL